MTKEQDAYLRGLWHAALICQDISGDKKSLYSHKIMRLYQKTRLKMEQGK